MPANPSRICITIGTAFRPLSSYERAGAVEAGATDPYWGEDDPRFTEGVPFVKHDQMWDQWTYLQIRPNLMPPGCNTSFLPIYNLPTWDAYRQMIANARTIQATYLMVIEDDVYVPGETVRRLFALLEHDKTLGAAGGLYWWRRQPTDPDFPQLYKEAGQGPWLDYPKDQIVRVEAAGLGCCMFRMSALADAEKFGGLFEEPYEIAPGLFGKGGDLCLFHRLKQAGHGLVVDTALKAWHRDPHFGAWFPFDKRIRAAYGWPARPLEGFVPERREEVLQALRANAPTGTAAEQDPEGNCSLCKGKVRASVWDAHIAAHQQAFPDRVVQNVGIKTVPVPVPEAGNGKPHADSGAMVVPLGVPIDQPDDAIPALNLGWGGYKQVHPDFQQGYEGRAFAWEYQDAFAHPGTTPDLVCDATQRLPRANGSYGLVYANHLIEHLPRAKAAAFLAEAWRLVRPGGRLYIACPDGEQVWRAFQARGSDLDAKVYDAPIVSSDGKVAGVYPVTFRHIIYGRSAFPGDEHRHMYAAADLCAAFAEAGIPKPFTTADVWIPMGLRAIAQKPKAVETAPVNRIAEVAPA